MQEYELRAWLGDVEATDEQMEALMRLSDEIDERFPGGDDVEDHNEAFNGGAFLILGLRSRDDLRTEWENARAEAHAAHRRMVGGIIADHTDTEVALSERWGLSRMTVRKALGK